MENISRPLYVVRQYCTGKIVNVVRLSPICCTKEDTEIKKAARAWMEADDQDKITIIYDTDDFFLQELVAYTCGEDIRRICREYE